MNLKAYFQQKKVTMKAFPTHFPISLHIPFRSIGYPKEKLLFSPIKLQSQIPINRRRFSNQCHYLQPSMRRQLHSQTRDWFNLIFVLYQKSQSQDHLPLAFCCLCVLSNYFYSAQQVTSFLLTRDAIDYRVDGLSLNLVNNREWKCLLWKCESLHSNIFIERLMSCKFVKVSPKHARP